VSQDIPVEKITQVAKGAIEHVTQGVEDRSQDMSVRESTFDFFCCGLKRKALNRVHDLSHHTACLHTELEKLPDQRNQKAMKTHVEEIRDSQDGLIAYMPRRSIEFGRTGMRSIVGRGSYLIYRDQTRLNPVGIPLYKPFEPAQGTTDVSLTTLSMRTPRFDSPDHIAIRHLPAIKACGQLICAGKTVQVRFHALTEPVVMDDNPDVRSTLLQCKLTQLWITFESKVALKYLNAILPAAGILPLPAILPELLTGQTRTEEDAVVEGEWEELARTTTRNFQVITMRLQKAIFIQKNKLVRIFKGLEGEHVPVQEQRHLLLETTALVPGLLLRQEDKNRNIEGIRKMVGRLFLLSRDCQDGTIRDAMKYRIESFNVCIRRFTTTTMGKTETGQQAVKDLNDMLRNQDQFLNNFDAAQLLMCRKLLNPRDIILTDGARVKAPLVVKLRKELIVMLKNPTSPWQTVQDGMERLCSKQVRDIILLTHQLNTALSLILDMQTFMGARGEGLNLKTGKSFYTPETYSRIVTLKQLRDQLQNKDEPLSKDELNTKLDQITDHLSHIRQESAAMKKAETAYFFRGHRMYAPTLNINGSHKNFAQCSHYQLQPAWI